MSSGRRRPTQRFAEASANALKRERHIWVASQETFRVVASAALYVGHLRDGAVNPLRVFGGHFEAEACRDALSEVVGVEANAWEKVELKRPLSQHQPSADRRIFLGDFSLPGHSVASTTLSPNRLKKRNP